SPSAPPLQPPADGRLPIIPSEPSALQNIADTANRLVARLDQVLSEENIKRIAATLEHLEQASGSIAGRRDEISELIVNARDATATLKTTLAHADGAIQGIDRNFVQRLPALLDKLDAVVVKLDATAGSANAMIAENRPALQSFTSDGLAQLGPTLVELRALMRDLRALSGRLEGNPARYILGRDAPKEFDPK